MAANPFFERPALSLQTFCGLLIRSASTLTGCQEWAEFSCSPGHPSDDTLIASWQTQRAAFDELIAIFVADEKLEDVADDWMRPETVEAAGINEARLLDYRRRFKELGVRDGLRSYGNKQEIWLITSACGLSVSGSAKGYLYLQEGMELPDWGAVVDGDLDAYRSPDGESYDAFRPLSDGWYLYYSYED